MVSELATPREAVELDATQLEAYLLEQDGDVNAQDDTGATLLHRAVRAGNLESAELLIEHGAEVNATDESGDTPLHEAARSGHTEMVELLTEHGAAMGARTTQDDGSEGLLPLEMAAANGHSETAELLRRKAVEAMKSDLRGWGVGLIVIGVISIALAGILDPIWGVLLIGLGAVTLLVRHRGMFIALGVALFLAGIINIALTGGSIFWVVFGLMQFRWGLQEIAKFSAYGGATRPVAPNQRAMARN